LEGSADTAPARGEGPDEPARDGPSAGERVRRPLVSVQWLDLPHPRPRRDGFGPRAAVLRGRGVDDADAVGALHQRGHTAVRRRGKGAGARRAMELGETPYLRTRSGEPTLADHRPDGI